MYKFIHVQTWRRRISAGGGGFRPRINGYYREGSISVPLFTLTNCSSSFSSSSSICLQMPTRRWQPAHRDPWLQAYDFLILFFYWHLIIVTPDGLLFRSTFLPRLSLALNLSMARQAQILFTKQITQLNSMTKYHTVDFAAEQECVLNAQRRGKPGRPCVPRPANSRSERIYEMYMQYVICEYICNM